MGGEAGEKPDGALSSFLSTLSSAVGLLLYATLVGAGEADDGVINDGCNEVDDADDVPCSTDEVLHNSQIVRAEVLWNVQTRHVHLDALFSFSALVVVSVGL